MKKCRLLCLITVVVFSLGFCCLTVACSNQTDERTLIIGTTNTVLSLNRLDATGGAPGYAYSMIADAVTQLSLITKSGGEYIPQIGNISADSENKVFTVSLDDGYTWHDGVPVTLEDVKFTFESEYPSDNIKSLVIAGEKLVITLATADFTIQDMFSEASIMPEHILKNATKDSLKDELSVVGCGAYKFSSLNKSAGTVTFEKYGQFKDVDKLFFDKIIFKHYDTASVLTLALKKGEVDMIWNYSTSLSADMVASLEGDENVTVRTEYTSKNLKQVLFFNNADERLTKNVKRAIAEAIDYDNVMDKLAGTGAALAYQGLVPSFDENFAGTSVWARNLEHARTLLKEEGYSSTNKFEFEILIRESDTQIADLIKTELEETGLITVKLDMKGTAADWQQTYQQGRHMACFGSVTAKGYDMQVGLSTKYLMPLNSSELENNPVCYGNIALENEQGLTDFGKIYFALKDGLADNAKYKAAAVEFQNYVVENTPAICLYLEGNSYAYNSRLSGFIYNEKIGLLNLQTYKNLKRK